MVVAGLTMVALFGACKVPNFGQISYEEATVELIRLVDAGLEAGLRGPTDLPKPPTRDVACGETEEIQAYPDYEYHFPLEMLGPDPDAFAVRVAEFWESEGFGLVPDDFDPGIVGSFAESDDFNLQVFVNRNTDMALVAGSGPCVPKPED